jgi:cytochrome c oxidase cbb3-type subunit 3
MIFIRRQFGAPAKRAREFDNRLARGDLTQRKDTAPMLATISDSYPFHCLFPAAIMTTLAHLYRLAMAILLALTAMPAMAADGSANGEKLYNRHCAACHGFGGHGGVGVPLSLKSFLASVDDNYLGTSIRVGRPGRVMPAFRQMPEEDVKAIVAHLRSWGGSKAPVHAKAAVRGNPVKGKKLYEQRCASCHGAHGEGGHGTGVTFSRPRDLPILAPALNNPGFLASASDEMIRQTLIRGRENTPMQPFLKQGMSHQDINDVTAYVRSFERAALPASARLLEIESPILIRDSTYTFEETLEKLKTAISAANLRLIRIQTLDQGFVPEGKEDRRQTIVYSCDFRFLNEALKVDPRVGLFLPCRITVIEQEGKVRVMSINPKSMSKLFNNAELNTLCERMHQIYTDILEESVL